MILLVITLLGLSITSYYLNNRNLVSPAFLLSTTFFICSLVALISYLWCHIRIYYSDIFS